MNEKAQLVRSSFLTSVTFSERDTATIIDRCTDLFHSFSQTKHQYLTKLDTNKLGHDI